MLRIDSKSDGFANIPGDPRIGYLEVYNSDQALKETTQTRTIELESSLPSHAALQPGSTAVYTAALYVEKLNHIYSITVSPTVQCELQLYFVDTQRIEQDKSSTVRGHNHARNYQ